MKPTCQDFVFARDGGMGRSPTEEAIIDYIDRSKEVAPPSPAVEREREIVVGSIWANCGGGHVIVLSVDASDVRYRWLSDDEIGQRSLATFRERWSHVSDPQPASPDARPDPTDPGVIRAAEGVVLEPGEYEVVEISIHDVRPCVAVGDLVKVYGLKRACGTPPYWRIGGPHDLSLVTAVRRVQEQAPQVAPGEALGCNCMWPVAPRGPNHGVRCPLYSYDAEPEQAPQAEAATGERADHCPSCYSGNRQRAEGCSDSFHRTARPEVAPATPPDGSHLIDGEFQSDKYPTTPRGKVPLSVKDVTAQDLLWEYAQRRRKVDAQFADDLETALRTAGFAPATPRSESASHAHWVQVADTRLGQIRGLNKQLDSTRNELHRASIGRNEALAKAAEQSSCITYLEASLETARFELSNGVSVMNARQAHDRARIAELKTELSQVARDEDGRFVRQAAWNAACCFEESANKRMATDKEKLYELDAQLSTRTAELEAAPQWIRARGSLPDSDTWVLAVSREADYVVVQLEFTDDSEGHGEPYWSAEGGDLALCNYPHWMPLPSPPAESPEPAPGVEAPEVKP